MTLLQIIDNFERIALSQPNIRSVGEGSIYEFMNTNPSLEFGVFFITQNTHIEYEEYDRYGLTLFYCDRLEDDLESNRLRIQSHAKQVLGNIITIFCNQFEVDFPEITYTAFTQKFKMLTAGMYVSILIDVYKDTICEDGEGPVWEKIGVLQNKNITITNNGTVTVTPDAGYDGLKTVVVNVDVVDEDCFEQGFESGVTYQKSLLSSTAFTANDTYTSENGWSSVTVNVVDEECYERGLADGFESGTTYQKSLLSSTSFTQNSTYELENGWSSVTVNVVPQLTDLNVSVNGTYTPPQGYVGYSAVTVNVNSGECNMQILYVELVDNNGNPVTAASFTVAYADQEDTYSYAGTPQEVSVYPGLDYVVSFGNYEHHIAPESVSGTSYWGDYKEIIGVYDWLSNCYVDPENMMLPSTGGSDTINVYADGAWTATSVGDWYVQNTTTGTGNGTVNVSAVENTTGHLLEGNINFEFYDGTTASTYVSQKPSTYLDVDEKHILFEYSGSTYHLAVSSNTDYTITTPEWITYEYVDNMLVLSASSIGSTHGRHDFVVFTYDGYTKEIDVNQVHPDYVMYVTSSDTFTTELIQNNTLQITNQNVGGETFIGSNCQHVVSASTVPDLQMFAVDVPTTTCSFESCACDVSSLIDLMVLPKGVHLPSSYYGAYGLFNGLKVLELRINCKLPRNDVYNNRAYPSLCFDYVNLTKIGPDSITGNEKLPDFALINGSKSSTGGTAYKGYTYTSFVKYKVEFYRPTPLSNYDVVGQTSYGKYYYLGYAGVGTIHSSEYKKIQQSGPYATSIWVPGQINDITIPSWIREKFV